MLKLYVFGGVVLTDGEGHRVQSVMAQPKRLALLVYLAGSGPTRCRRRQTLLGLFWPESDEDHARTSLNQAVYYLRRSLGEQVIMSYGADELTVSDEVLWADIREFRQACGEGRFADALDLYGGEFLEGFYLSDVPELEHWIEREREELRRDAWKAATALASAAEGHQCLPEAIEWAKRAVALLPDNEAAARYLIELQARCGEHAGALRTYDLLAEHLRRTYDAQPSEETQALVQALHAPSADPDPSAAPAQPTTPASASPDVPHHQADSQQLSDALPPNLGVQSPAVHPVPNAPRGFSRRTKILAAGLAAAITVVAIGSLARFGNGSSEPSSVADRQVLVPEFSSPSGDSLLAQLVSDALKIDLEQSRLLQVMELEDLAVAFAQMDRTSAMTDAPTLHILYEAALRAGIDAVLTGTVHRVTGTYVLTARLSSPETQQTVAAARETAVDSTDLVPAIERLSRRLRADLGEPLHALRESPPLEQVTTSSLSALRSYTQAVHAIDDEGDYARGIALLEQAVKADSAFAMAHRKLASVLENVGGQQSRALDANERAYRHRDRLTERERYLVIAGYHGTTNEEAIVAYRSLLDLRPNDPYALNNLGYVYEEVGDDERAAYYYRRAAVADSSFILPLVNLVSSEFDRGNPAEAEAALNELARRFPESPWRLAQGFQLAAARGDYNKAEALARELRRRFSEDRRWRIAAERNLAYIAALQGRLAEAEAHMQEAMEDLRQAEMWGSYLQDAAMLAMLDIHARSAPEKARMRLDRTLQEHPLEQLPPEDRALVALASAYADAGAPERARELLEQFQADSDPRVAEVTERKVRPIRASILLAEGKSQAAIAELRRIGPSSCTVCVLPLVGRAYEKAGATDSAIAAYERYLTRPEFFRLPSDAVWKPYVYQRLGHLHTTLGNARQASAYRATRASLWQKADADVNR